MNADEVVRALRNCKSYKTKSDLQITMLMAADCIESLQAQLAEYDTLAAEYGIDGKTMLTLAKSQIRTAQDNIKLREQLTALREKAEREKGCEWCRTPSFNLDVGNSQIVFFRSKAYPSGAYGISVSVFDEYGEEQEPVLVQIDNCIRCGKRLEVEP